MRVLSGSYSGFRMSEDAVSVATHRLKVFGSEMLATVNVPPYLPGTDGGTSDCPIIEA